MIKYVTPAIEFVALSSRGILTANIISSLDGSQTDDDFDLEDDI